MKPVHNSQEQATGDHQTKTNGYPVKPNGAEPHPRSLSDVCLALREKLDAFLATEQEKPLLRTVQARLRVSMELAEQALKQYRYFFTSVHSS